MKISEALRRLIFWCMDFLAGGKVRKQYNDIKLILNNTPVDKIKGRCSSYLDRILKHATETTAFYIKYMGYKSLEDFPVINKSVIKENTDDFLSNQFQKDKLHKVTTSGSTGAPLTVWQDTGKRVRHQAENIYFSELAEYSLGSRLYYLRVWNSLNRKSMVKRLQQNIIMQDAGDLSDRNFESFIMKLKKDTSTKSVLAFSSTHEALSHYVFSKLLPLPVKVSSLITISETLPEEAKNILKKAFNCPVISRYSNMENGFLAQQCIKDNHEYHINRASFHIELLDPEKDEPVAEGKLGRIVVTDLFNFAMPLIRYDTGDMAVMAEKSVCGAPGPVFTSVEGRKVDFIHDTKGNLLSPHVITNTMWRYSAQVRQFQFIQESSSEYIIKLNCLKSGFDRSGELITDLKHYLGQDATIGIELVDDIPVLASGKRKKIVNNYLKA